MMSTYQANGGWRTHVPASPISQSSKWRAVLSEVDHTYMALKQGDLESIERLPIMIMQGITKELHRVQHLQLIWAEAQHFYSSQYLA